MALVNITGRDGIIIAWALFQTIQHSSKLSQAERSLSNEDDARKILDTCFPGYAAAMIKAKQIAASEAGSIQPDDEAEFLEDGEIPNMGVAFISEDEENDSEAVSRNTKEDR